MDDADRPAPLTALDRVVLTPYDQGWPERAGRELARLRELLGPAVLYADHIGSTSVPGMAAKNVLDLQLSVANLELAEAEFTAPLAAAGIEVLPYHHDHVPAGRNDSPELWAKRCWHRRGIGDDVNLHVRLAGSPNERLALLFRDWLRVTPDAVAAYSRFKAVLGESVPGLQAYTGVKDPVVDLVVVAAEQWATRTGWCPHPDPATQS